MLAGIDLWWVAACCFSSSCTYKFVIVCCISGSSRHTTLHFRREKSVRYSVYHSVKVAKGISCWNHPQVGPFLADESMSILGLCICHMATLQWFYDKLLQLTVCSKIRLLDRLPQAVFAGNETMSVLHARRLAAALYFVGPHAVCLSLLDTPVSWISSSFYGNFLSSNWWPLSMSTFLSICSFCFHCFSITAVKCLLVIMAYEKLVKFALWCVYVHLSVLGRPSYYHHK